MGKRLRERDLRQLMNDHGRRRGRRRHDDFHHRDDVEDLCERFADILQGDSQQVVNDVCVVTRFREELNPTILGRRTESPLAIAALFSFEDLDRKGDALNLGETVILQGEIQEFIRSLQKEGLIVTALHNHWLFDDPRLMYIHWESVEPPLEFARKTARAFEVLEG